VVVVTFINGSIFARSIFGIKKDIQSLLPVVNVCRPVNAAVFPLPVTQVIFHDVENPGHLAEDENMMTILVQSLQHAIQQGNCTAGTNQQLRMGGGTNSIHTGTWVNGLSKHEGMIDILAVIHHFVCLA
jgi:hypothetical protein